MPCRSNILFLCIGLCCLLATNPKTINYYFTAFGAEGSPASNATLYVSVNTDSPNYSVGKDITILGNVSDARGNKVGAVVSLEIAYIGNNSKISASVYAKNGSFHYIVPAMEPVGNYNLTAEVVGHKGEASTTFNVVHPRIPILPITVGVLSLIGFIFVLIYPLLRKGEFTTEVAYIPEVMRFLSLTGIALSIISFFLYFNIEFAINSPIGLVIKHSSGTGGGITEW
ncbi:MAG TPA: hypothetical protein VH481_07980 [Nitrososphaeraceae archaeon]